jgi:hypothetical protein
MARTTQEANIERRKTLVEWIIAITTIFWSVWWGFYMQALLPNADSDIDIPIKVFLPSFTIKLPGALVLVCSAVVVSVFAIVFVLWLWEVHKTAYQRFLLRSFVRSSAPLAFSLLTLLGGILLIGNAVGVSPSLMNYGALLTLFWPPVVLVTIWKV